MAETKALLSENTAVQYIEGRSRTITGDGIHGHGHGGKNSWVSSASIIVAQMLGAGVLGLPYASHLMGWYGAIIVLVFITAFSIYGGLILGWLRDGDPNIVSYPQLAETVASRAGQGVYFKRFCQSIGYVYILGSCTIYLTTCKLSLMQVLSKCDRNGPPINTDCSNSGCTDYGVIEDFSNVAWLLLAAAILYPLVHVRSLSDAGIVAYIGVATIAVVNVTIIARAIYDETGGKSEPTNDTPTSLQDFVNGLTVLTFAYGGHVLMVDIQAVMEKPQDWPKAVWGSQLFMFANYAIVGFLGFSVYGKDVQAPITLSLPDNWLRMLTNVCLFIHVAVAYCINSTVLVTAVVNAIWPDLLSSGTTSQKVLKWGIAATGILGLAILIASVIPFFSDLMNIYSSIGIFSLSFVIPILLLLIRFGADMSWLSKLLHRLLVLIVVIGCGFGLWAAVEDIMQKWTTPLLCRIAVKTKRHT